jgi:hypothetical protein
MPTHIQALDERRLVVEVDMRGIVQAVISSSSPASLFGFEPHRLMGRSLGDVVDVLHVEGRHRVNMGMWMLQTCQSHSDPLC